MTAKFPDAEFSGTSGANVRCFWQMDDRDHPGGAGDCASSATKPSSEAEGGPKAPPSEAGDRLFVYSRTERETYKVLRSRADRIEMGELASLKEGRPIQGEVVKLSPIEGRNNLYDVEVLVDSREKSSTGRPAQVANAAYRRNWEAIFGKSDIDPSAAN